MLPRVVEPEVMDSEADAREYDAMDHVAVNELFVTDFLQSLTDWSLTWAEAGRRQRPVQSATLSLNILDLGAGTAQIPIELARRAPHVHITALDAAPSMLALAEQNIAAAGLTGRITPLLADAKQLPFDVGSFHAVISNSIFHHIPVPRDAVREAVRVTAPAGLLFHRDLCRPDDERQLNHLVDTYAAGANNYQRKLFADSLHAALTLDEMQRIVAGFGFAPETVRMTSDRHWSWTTFSTQYPVSVWPGSS
jgi:ubiquinone/menaquinone biosynthesis C-methylase UbiE